MSSILAGDFKTGLTLEIDGEIFQVLDFQHVKPGKGAAILKTKLKNLRSGGTYDRTFNASTKFETAMIERKPVQYSYNTGDSYSFMDMSTYESYELSDDQIGYNKNFLVEGMEVVITFYESEVLGIALPDKVDLVVTETTDAVRGNTATNATKDAIVETGLLVKVPLFIQQGEKISIFTADGKYSGRAN